MSLTAPSHAQSCDRIRRNPKFQQLVRRRSRLSWSLSAAVLGTYYSFMLVVAFAPQWLHAPLSQGGMLSVGIPVAASIIVVSSCLPAGTYAPPIPSSTRSARNCWRS